MRHRRIIGSYNPTLVRQMASKIEHRGPDSCGFLTQKISFLLECSVINFDIANGDQPIKSRDGSVSIFLMEKFIIINT